MFEVLHITGKVEFLRMLQASDMPVLVKFGHEQCPPCVAVEPILHKFAQDFGAELRIVEINTRNPNNEELRAFAPDGVPQFRFYLNGDERDALLGFGEYAALRKWLVQAMRNCGRTVEQDSEKERIFAETLATLWADVVNTEADARPAKWEAYFNGIKPAVDVYLGLSTTGGDTAVVDGAVCPIGDPSCRS